MKGILLALVVIVAVLFVTVECRRGSKRGKGRLCTKGCRNCTESGTCIDCKAGFKLNQDTDQCEKDCGRNCVNCDGRRCVECDNGFARITLRRGRFNKTVCTPCTKQTSLRRKGADTDNSKCPTVNTTPVPCNKKCAKCSNGMCRKCDKGFALVSLPKRGDSKVCIPCAKAAAKAGKFENADKSQCSEKCRRGFERNPETEKCEKKKSKKGGRKKPKNKGKEGNKRKSKVTPSPEPAP